MDSEKVKKKFFDVSPPAVATTTTAPTVPRRQMIAVNEPSEPVTDPLLGGATVSQNHKAASIVPLSPIVVEEATDKKELVVDTTPTEVAAPEEIAPVASEEPVPSPSIDPLPDTQPQPPVDTPIEVPTDDASNSPDTPVNDQYVATDALPDPSEKAANDLKSSMQEPRIYDTTAYHVPIKNAEHGHGGIKMAFLVGALFAAAVVGGVVYYMGKLGS